MLLHLPGASHGPPVHCVLPAHMPGAAAAHAAPGNPVGPAPGANHIRLHWIRQRDSAHTLGEA